MRLIQPGEPLLAALLFLWAGILFACAVYAPLRKRLPPPEDRRHLMERAGPNELTWPQRHAFEDGRVIPGMGQGIVLDLYGEPDEQMVRFPKIRYEGVLDYTLKDIWWLYFDGMDTAICLLIRDSVVIEVGAGPREGL